MQPTAGQPRNHRRRSRVPRLRIGRTDATLQDLVDTLAGAAAGLLAGTAWNYSHSTDIVGYLVEVISGQRLDSYLQEHIFEPLGMRDTAFWVAPEQAERLATNYACSATAASIEVVDDAATSPLPAGADVPLGRRRARLDAPATTCASAGCCSATGALDGARIIGRKTLELMTKNHLTGASRSLAAPRRSGEARPRRTRATASASGSRWRWTRPTARSRPSPVATGPAPRAPTSGSTRRGSGRGLHDPVHGVRPAPPFNLARELRAIVYGALE